MRILALDPGTRRVGVAVSDELQMIAQPLEYIPPEPFADFLKFGEPREGLANAAIAAWNTTCFCVLW